MFYWNIHHFLVHIERYERFLAGMEDAIAERLSKNEFLCYEIWTSRCMEIGMCAKEASLRAIFLK